MATAQFAQMGATPNMFKSDLDMDSLFDFNGGAVYNEPRATSSASVRPGPSNQHSQQQIQSYEDVEERQTFAGPSHEYDRFKQQTGINLSHLNQPIPTSFGGFNSGVDDMTFNGSWSGIEMDSDMNMDFGSNMPAMFYGPGEGSQSQSFVDPTSIDVPEEPQSNVGRLWPGMHSQQAQQQAAMSKARALQQQQQQQQHASQLPRQQTKAAGKQRATSYQQDPETEESISRLLNRMRQSSTVPTIHEEDTSVQDGFYSGMSRMRKDEEDMDEDERLLASEEGKKLSSKERRQLRNKVSARAFRSRRKEYIGQLEGDLNQKAQECNSLKNENNALSEENSRYRGLIQFLLRHPSFTPFLEDISKDPAFIESQIQPQRPMTNTPVPTVPSSTQPSEVKLQRTPSQMSNISKQESHHVGMNMIPEAPVNMNMLNLTNGGYAMQQNMGYNFQHPPQQQNPHTFALHSVPQGPSPLDLAVDVVKKTRQDEVNDFASYNGMQW